MIQGVVLDARAQRRNKPHTAKGHLREDLFLFRSCCMLHTSFGAPMKLGAVWSCERHHWGLESLAEAKRLDPRGQGPWADPILILGFFLWVGPSISGPRTVTFQNLPVHSALNIVRLKADFSVPDQEAFRMGGYCSSALIERTLMVQASFWVGTMPQCCLATGA